MTSKETSYFLYIISKLHFLKNQYNKLNITTDFQLMNRIKYKTKYQDKEIQDFIAILDKFDALVNDISIGLPAEIQACRQQYEYYREKLLTFKKYE